MQSHMQANNAIESCMLSDNVVEVQCDGMKNTITFRKCRAYQARPKGKGILVHPPSNQQKAPEREDKASISLRASTPSDIDLPPSSIQSDVNSITQDFMFDEDEKNPASNEALPYTLTVSPVPECLKTNVVTDSSRITGDFKTDTADANVSSDSSTVHTISRSGKTLNVENAPSDTNNLQEIYWSPGSRKKEKNAKGSAQNRLRRKRFTTRNNEKKIQIPALSKRPQHQVLGFMEDHAEFGSDWAETSDCRGRYMSSVLESTVDGSIIKGARRLYGSRMTSEGLASCIDSAIQVGDIDDDHLKVLDDWGLKTELHKYKCSECEEISQHRADIEWHVTKSKCSHSEAVVVVLLGSKAQGRNCSICNIRLRRTEYFKHIREVHEKLFPLRCGYCVFQGQDHNQLRHHIQKKHNTSDYKIIDASHTLRGEDITEHRLAASDYEEISNDEDEHENVSATQSMICPLCGKSLKTLRNLKKHVVLHSRQKKQCILCSFTTNFPTQIRSHYHRRHPTEKPKWKKIIVEKGGSEALVEDATPYLKMISEKYGVRKPKAKKWMRQYRCPHCDYTCNYNSSYNRHLRVHEGLKPFKCGYCSFHGREAYLVRKHSAKTHKGKKVNVEVDRNFKSPYRYAKKMKDEKYEWGEPNDMLYSKFKVEMQDIANETDMIKYRKKNGLKDQKRGNSSPKSSGISNERDSHITGDEASNIHAPLDIEKLAIESCALSNLNNLKEVKVAGVNTNGYENPLPRARWDILNEQPDKQNLNLLLEDNGSSVLIMSHEKNDLYSDSQETFPNKRTDEGLQKVTGKADQSPQKDKTLLCTSSSLSRSSQTVKVKVFRKSSESFPNDSLQECRNNNMQFSNLSMESTSKTDRICSCVVINPSSDSLSDAMDETVIIQLYANENENSILKEVITYNASEELEDGYILNEQPCGTSKLDLSVPLKVISSDTAPIQSNEEIDNFSLVHRALKENDVTELECYEFVKNVKGADCDQDKNSFKLEQISKVPSHGLENTLHTHITFLTDSLSHRLSNRISAPPGVMTRDLLGLDYSNSDYFSSEKVRMMMKKKKGGRVKCRECGVTTTCRAFYKHAKKHFNIKPFKCGYCTYRSIEKSKIRVHNAFCHPRKPCIILKLSPETAGIDDNSTQPITNENITTASIENGICTSRNSESCLPNLLEKTKNLTGKSSSKDSKIIDGENTLTSSVDTAVMGSLNKLPSFHCPICSKSLKNHTPSIRRHLYSHYGYKPYKCGYCSFTAIGQTEIRAHHVTHGSINSPKIESSGASMPFVLTRYINELLSQQRGSKRCHKKREQYNPSQDNLPKNPDADIMWHDPDISSKEELTAMMLNTEDQSQHGLVSDDQHELEALGVEPCSLQQSLESSEFHSEATYAVQVLESDRQNSNSFSSDLTPQLDLNLETNSNSDVSTDPVCVVYLID